MVRSVQVVRLGEVSSSAEVLGLAGFLRLNLDGHDEILIAIKA